MLQVLVLVLVLVLVQELVQPSRRSPLKHN